MLYKYKSEVYPEKLNSLICLYTHVRIEPNDPEKSYLSGKLFALRDVPTTFLKKKQKLLFLAQ